MTKERIGFIGVGLMGHGMAKNIVEKGYPLTVMAHRNRVPVEDLKQRGAEEARTPREVARASTVIFLCVTGSREVEQVVRGADGLKAGARPGTIIVDASTSDPTSTLQLAEELASEGIAFVDAPLSRTPKEAWEGTLDTMVGCDVATFERVRPVLETWAGKIVHVGPVGHGHAMKLINNFVSLGYAAVYSEALTLAHKAGLSAQTVDSVIRGGRMDCGFYQTFMRYVLERDRDAHKFSLKNGYKDLRYAGALADALGVANPIGSAIRNSFALAVNGPHADAYVPMLSDVIAESNGVSLVEPPPRSA
jgi:3-hydroxyisobutyrate dehydrogenase-like beta-hydroxyacid dehydrogenase